jgi:hypothetical protein
MMVGLSMNAKRRAETYDLKRLTTRAAASAFKVVDTRGNAIKC